MKPCLTGTLISLSLALSAIAQEPVHPGQAPMGVAYALLDGSFLIDDCLVCGRPTVMQELRGTFDLVPVQDTPPYFRYAVRNVDFTAGPGWAGETRLTGNGTYTRFEEFARLQDMDLVLQVSDTFTNQLAWFTNETVVAEKPFPVIAISLSQSNGTLLQTFRLDLLAAPLRELWFSTTRALTSTNLPSPDNAISPGDLLSSRGRVVKRNGDLAARLGVMPIVPNLGLDAVQVVRRGEILFSIPNDIWSETLGHLGHGDLLSNRGAIVKRNRDLLAAFGVPAAYPDAGLDAVQVLPDGEILFSICSNVVMNPSLTLARGDILSDRGTVVRSQRDLLANFHPAVSNVDFGLDAVHVLPGGEVWFSVEEPFIDNWLGTIPAGDLLSSLGHRVLRNEQLVAAFGPAVPNTDYGLDALFVITDTHAHWPPPRLVKCRHMDGAIWVEWDGDGAVFQLEHAPSMVGPWSACSPILLELIADDRCDFTPGAAGFYRVRQW